MIMKFSQLRPLQGSKTKFGQSSNAVIVQKNIFGASNPSDTATLGRGVLGKLVLAKEN